MSIMGMRVDDALEMAVRLDAMRERAPSEGTMRERAPEDVVVVSPDPSAAEAPMGKAEPSEEAEPSGREALAACLADAEEAVSKVNDAMLELPRACRMDPWWDAVRTSLTHAGTAIACARRDLAEDVVTVTIEYLDGVSVTEITVPPTEEGIRRALERIVAEVMPKGRLWTEVYFDRARMRTMSVLQPVEDICERLCIPMGEPKEGCE